MYEFINQNPAFSSALLTCFVGILGLIIAIKNVNKQIKNSAYVEKIKIDRKAKALRSGLPITISELMNDQFKIFHQLYSILEKQDIECTNYINSFYSTDFAMISKDNVKYLIEIIEYGDEKISLHVANLLSFVQIQGARLRVDPRRNAGSGHLIIRYNLLNYLIDCIEIQIQLEQLFPFARMQSKNFSSKKISSDDYYRNLRLNNASDALINELGDIIVGRVAR